ncbi:MAG: hypothetical protein AVDCRST_MAG54-3920, partial [uncultured Actinomycetospora sp.]
VRRPAAARVRHGRADDPPRDRPAARRPGLGALRRPRPLEPLGAPDLGGHGDGAGGSGHPAAAHRPAGPGARGRGDRAAVRGHRGRRGGPHLVVAGERRAGHPAPRPRDRGAARRRRAARALADLAAHHRPGGRRAGLRPARARRAALAAAGPV